MTSPALGSVYLQERNQAATAFVGDLDPRVDDAILWELMLQAGPVVNVHIPKDKLTGDHMGYGFVEFATEDDCEYAIKIMNMIKLFGKPVRVNPAARSNKVLDVGANLFVGNLDPEVDEKLLYDTFSAFGVIISTPKIMRDPDCGVSRGFGFISFDCFEASDMAIEAMNGQYLCNRPMSVSYAIKKDSKGERHGSEAERELASRMKQLKQQQQQQRPNMLFGTGPAANPAMAVPGMAPPMPPGMMHPGMMMQHPGMMAPGMMPPGMMMHPGMMMQHPGMMAPGMMPPGMMHPPPGMMMMMQHPGQQ